MAIAPETGSRCHGRPPSPPGTEDRGVGRPASITTVSPGSGGLYGWLPATSLPGTVIYADSTAGTTGPQLLYSAIGAGNLRAWVQGQDYRGGAALAN
jgi:hypothetical protein